MVDKKSSQELAQRLSKALDTSEEAFLAELMAAISARGWSLVARQIDIDRVSLHRYATTRTRKPRFDALVKMTAACGVKFRLVPL